MSHCVVYAYWVLDKQMVLPILSHIINLYIHRFPFHEGITIMDTLITDCHHDYLEFVLLSQIKL